MSELTDEQLGLLTDALAFGATVSLRSAYALGREAGLKEAAELCDSSPWKITADGLCANLARSIRALIAAPESGERDAGATAVKRDAQSPDWNLDTQFDAAARKPAKATGECPQCVELLAAIDRWKIEELLQTVCHCAEASPFMLGKTPWCGACDRPRNWEDVLRTMSDEERALLSRASPTNSALQMDLTKPVPTKAGSASDRE